MISPSPKAQYNASWNTALVHISLVRYYLVSLSATVVVHWSEGFPIEPFRCPDSEVIHRNTIGKQNKMCTCGDYDGKILVDSS